MSDIQKQIIYNLKLMTKPALLLSAKEIEFIMSHMGQYRGE